MYAHLTKVSGGYRLIVTPEMRPVGGTEYRIATRKEARALCAALSAKPWNF